MPMPNLLDVGSNKQWILLGGLDCPYDEDRALAEQAGYSQSEITAALIAKQRSSGQPELALEALKDDFFEDDDQRFMLREDPQNTNCFIELAGRIANRYAYLGEQSVPGSVPENVQGIERALTDLAANRDAWHSQISKILTQDLWQVHIVTQTQWKKWRHCFNTRIPWDFNAGLSWIGDSLAFTWLDDESGFINFTLGQDLVYEEVEMYIGHARMLHSFCSMSILLDQSLLDSYLPQLLNCHRRILSKFQVVLLFEVCPAKWLEKIITSRAAVLIRGVLWPAAQSPHAKRV